MRPKKAGVPQPAQLDQAGQAELVVDHAAPDALVARRAGDGERVVERLGDRLFGIDVLAGADRLQQQVLAHLRGRGVEEQGVVRVGERRIQIGRPAFDAVRFGERRELRFVAADQDRVGDHPVAVAQAHAALGADGADRAHQMLVRPHAPGDAVHDQPEAMRGHLCLSRAAGLRTSVRRRPRGPTSRSRDRKFPRRAGQLRGRFRLSTDKTLPFLIFATPDGAKRKSGVQSREEKPALVALGPGSRPGRQDSSS